MRTMTSLSRRDLLRVAIALPAAGLFAHYRAMAAPNVNRVKITNVRAMAVRNIAGNCLIRIDTDGGLTGYGEAGATGPMARARIETMKGLLIGKDPLLIEVHFHNMTTLMHTYMAHIPTISGIDMALWDLAGKIIGAPVSTLLGVPSARFAPTLTTQQLRNVAHGYANCREAVGDDIDIAVHCHNELDTPSAMAVAKAVEPMNPLFIEDALNPPFSEAWMALRRSTRVPLLTGEKLEMVRGFKPFLDNQAVDIIHPDLAFAGGITGTRKIADYAAQFRIPVALHNVGSLVLTYANAHFGASIQNFYRSESQLGRPGRYIEGMAAGSPPDVRKGLLKVPTGSGLGLEINPDFLQKNLAPEEAYWG